MGMITGMSITTGTTTARAATPIRTTSRASPCRWTGRWTGPKFTAWLDRLLAEKGQDILRAKGIIDVAGEDRRLVFQAVHMILEGDLQRPWGDKERRWSRAVFIGRDLDEAALKAGFEACAA